MRACHVFQYGELWIVALTVPWVREWRVSYSVVSLARVFSSDLPRVRVFLLTELLSQWVVDLVMRVVKDVRKDARDDDGDRGKSDDSNT